MELAEVSEFRSPYLSVKEVVDHWEVSERTLRRRLASGAPDCHQDESGQWCLSAEWIDSQFHRRRRIRPVFTTTEPDADLQGELQHNDVTIDLTDAQVAPQDRWVQELIDTERRATKAETELEVRLGEIESLKAELAAAKIDINYERSLVNRLKDQLRGTDI